MKAYTVTEDQLENLGILQIASNVVFSLATGLLTFWIGVRQNIAFSDNFPTDAQKWWEGLATGALLGALLLALIGGFFLFRGHTTVSKIKRDTIHD
jgi:4-amino-4-deoxy-L-arabinose transferase-like glycosyltransferase